MATDGLTGGVNPFGNRGPDLIETIRLEKIVGNPFLGTAGSEGISKPHASVHVEDIPGHPRMGRKTIVRRPRSGPSQGRGWAEPAWNRPNTAQSSLQVHNDELKGEVLTPADPLPKSPSYAGSTGQRTHSPLGSPGGALSPSPGGGGSPQGSVASRTPSNPSQGTLVRPQTAPLAGSKEHKRELFRLKGAERQEKILQRLQLSQKARRDQGERDFAQLWDSITKTEATLVADVTEFLDLKQADAKRKQAALHREWHEKVFDPIQTQIDRQISHRVATTEGGLGQRWITASDEYLAANQRKEEFGLFRDIIIPDEYDPLVCRSKDIKYKVKYVDGGQVRLPIDDPVKLELTKAAKEKLMIPGPRVAAPPLGKDCLAPTMWDKLDATPYGRFDKMMAASNQPVNESKEKLRRSTVPFDHFNFERTRSAIDQEFPKPKRTFHSVVKR